jgi:hypothetical protein
MPTVPDPLRRQERLNTLEDILLAVYGFANDGTGTRSRWFPLCD